MASDLSLHHLQVLTLTLILSQVNLQALALFRGTLPAPSQAQLQPPYLAQYRLRCSSLAAQQPYCPEFEGQP